MIRVAVLAIALLATSPALGGDSALDTEARRLCATLGVLWEGATDASACTLDPETVDMLTVVLVGSSATRRFASGGKSDWVYTPRGYGDAPRVRKAGTG